MLINLFCGASDKIWATRDAITRDKIWPTRDKIWPSVSQDKIW
jgi:hypothetical protein